MDGDTRTLRLGDIEADGLYTLAEVAGLFRRTEATVQRWVKGGRVQSVPGFVPYLVLGRELLRLVGEQAAALPRKGETPAERVRRGEAARKRIAGLAKGRDR